MVNLLVTAALAAAAPMTAQAAPAMHEPALFVVHGAGTTVYIFGTFHALDGKSQWFNNKVRDAFEHSDELVLETVVPEDAPPPQAMTPQFRAPAMTASASFLATSRMAINAGQSQGMQVGNGADMVLRRNAEIEGKPVEGLETLQLQIDMFNHMPAALPAPRPRLAGAVAAAEMNGLSKAMNEMQAAWKRGDQSIFVAMLDQLKAASPETYRMMFTERNNRWADWIRARLQTPGTIFVAVGAGHLAGKDSLLVKLAERGLSSRRIY